MMGRFAPAWSQILHSLRTGETGFSKVYGMELFAYLSANPAESAIFDSLMEDVHGPKSAAISAAYDFAAFACLADIGGGNGSLLIEILPLPPGLAGHPVRPARRRRTRRAADRRGGLCRPVPGGRRKLLRVGALGRGWHAAQARPARLGDADALAILGELPARAARAAAASCVAEVILPEDDGPSVARHMDLSMLVLAGGQERTEQRVSRPVRRRRPVGDEGHRHRNLDQPDRGLGLSWPRSRPSRDRRRSPLALDGHGAHGDAGGGRGRRGGGPGAGAARGRRAAS